MKRFSAVIAVILVLSLLVSADFAFATETVDTPEKKPLKAPKKVKASGKETSNDVKVVWSKVKGATSYIVYRKASGKSLRKIAEVKKKCAYKDKNLPGKKTYRYYVKAVDDTGTYKNSPRSGASNKVKIKLYLTNDIRPYKWKAKTKRRTKLFKTKKGGKVVGYIPRGTRVEVTKMYPSKVKQGSSPKRVYLKMSKNGKVVRKGWARYRDVKGRISAEVSLKKGKALDWSKARKEEFVNDKKYKSKTKYLVWISTYTQRVNVFKKKNGKWRLIKTSRTVTGKFLHRTRLGDHYKIHKRQPRRKRFFFRKTTKYYYTHLAMFQGQNAFHTICWRLGTRIPVNSIKTNLQPGTKGCSRLPTYMAKWIYYKLPLKTRVIVY